jgi:hypothetical protein
MVECYFNLTEAYVATGILSAPKVEKKGKRRERKKDL